MSSEQKKKRQENTKRWLNNLAPERQAELKQKAREYHRNRYHNLMVEVKQFIMIYRVSFAGLFYMKLCLILLNNNFFIIKNVFQKLFMRLIRRVRLGCNRTTYIILIIATILVVPIQVALFNLLITLNYVEGTWSILAL